MGSSAGDRDWISAGGWYGPWLVGRHAQGQRPDGGTAAVEQESAYPDCAAGSADGDQALVVNTSGLAELLMKTRHLQHPRGERIDRGQPQTHPDLPADALGDHDGADPDRIQQLQATQLQTDRVDPTAVEQGGDRRTEWTGGGAVQLPAHHHDNLAAADRRDADVEHRSTSRIRRLPTTRRA